MQITNSITNPAFHMKTSFISLIFLSIIFISVGLKAQTSMPAVVFKEDPLTHNMHIASDGEFLYTCNGGVPDKGQVSKFTLSGEKIGSYKLELDMRSILYNSADKKLYVSTYDKKLYRINDLMMGNYAEAWSYEDRDGQSTPAFSTDGKLVYFYEGGKVYIYDFKKGKLKKTLSHLDVVVGAPTESNAIAVDDKYIYTWNADEQIVLAYDKKGNFKKSFKLNQGDYVFSLSFANDMIWVSTDGNYESGTWYGYKLW
jgi:hypothetical protein